jgi:hypothetical protein
MKEIVAGSKLSIAILPAINALPHVLVAKVNNP